MNIIRNTVGIALAVVMFAVTAAPANAGFFDNSSSWSLESLYQNIQGISTKPEDATLRLSSVAPISSPANSKSSKAKTAVRTYTVSASAYSSSVDETDDTPFITAAGTYVRDGIVAANFLPLGTAIKIPDLYGDKIFIVEDRMNKRYHLNVDLWFPSKAEAKQFGRKTVKIEVVS